MRIVETVEPYVKRGISLQEFIVDVVEVVRNIGISFQEAADLLASSVEMLTVEYSEYQQKNRERKEYIRSWRHMQRVHHEAAHIQLQQHKVKHVPMKRMSRGKTRE